MLAEFDRAVGLGRLAAFHLNDSRAGLGSRLDRHENIGAGRIGLAAFRYLLEHPRLGALPMILETPKRDDGDARNLAPSAASGAGRAAPVTARRRAAGVRALPGRGGRRRARAGLRPARPRRAP